MISGKTFLKLTEDDLRKDMGFPLGIAKEVFQVIEELQKGKFK